MTLENKPIFTGSTGDRIQRRLDAITGRWWPYGLLLLLFLFRAYASGGYDPRDSLDVILRPLMDPLIFILSGLMPVEKVLTILLALGVLWLGTKAKRAFNLYGTLFYGGIAYFQNTAHTEDYGLVIVTSNLVIIAVVALLWLWEVFSGQNDFGSGQIPFWKWWVAPLIILTLLSPVDSANLSPDFNPVHLLTNEAGFTYCVMTPFFLAVLTLYHPRANLALLRVSSFFGTLFGVVNMLVWLFVMPTGWWMGVLHIPLLTIALYAFILAHRNDPMGDAAGEKSEMIFKENGS